MKTSLTGGLQTASATGPVNGTGADTSGLFGADFTITLRVTGMLSSPTYNPGARVVLEESTDGFVTAVPVAVVHLAASQNPHQDVRYSWRAYQLSQSLVGVQNARMRVNVASLRGVGSVTLEAWIDT